MRCSARSDPEERQVPATGSGLRQQNEICKHLLQSLFRKINTGRGPSRIKAIGKSVSICFQN
jgi:hypothetical protein